MIVKNNTLLGLLKIKSYNNVFIAVPYYKYMYRPKLHISNTLDYIE